MDTIIFDVEAALSETLPMPVLLGTDVPQLQDFIGQAFSGDNQAPGTEDVFAVTTRAQLLRQTEQKAILHQADKLSGVVPMALDPGHLVVSDIDDNQTPETQTQTPSNQTLQDIWMSELDDSLFAVNKTRPKLTRKQKRENGLRHKGVPEYLSSLTDISKEQLETLQKVDSTLEKIRKVVATDPDGTSQQFYEKDGLLYRQYIVYLRIWKLSN